MGVKTMLLTDLVISFFFTKFWLFFAIFAIFMMGVSLKRSRWRLLQQPPCAYLREEIRKRYHSDRRI